MKKPIYKNELPRHLARGALAEEIVERAFKESGWHVKRKNKGSDSGIDLIVERPGASYAVEIKAAPEGRGDRLLPIWSQAYLVGKAAEPNRKLLVVVVAPRINSRAIDQLISFAENYAPDAAVGIIDFEGLQVFRGSYLDDLNSINSLDSRRKSHPQPKPINLFSDLNQWMLKVLLAPSVPENLLSAPRSRYENASQLAESANVSVMSAFRFVERLKEDGYLDRSSSQLNLVRRKDLFHKWLAASAKPAKEIPVKFILRVDLNRELRRILHSGNRCLGLFAAADALSVGFVYGVPPHIYVRRIDESEFANIGNIREAGRDEAPDFILREARSAESVFRGRVEANGLFASDILQVWLDVSNHPSRGVEQGKFIEDRVLNNIAGNV
jgi:hypothetical protein